MKVISIILLLIVTMFMSFSCSDKQRLQMPFSNKQFENVADYINSISNIEKVESNSTDTETIFSFANNPYNFDEKSILVIYANNKKVYEGNFCSAVRIPLEQFEGYSIHFSVQILYPAKKNKYILYGFENKSIIMLWEKEYKFVYACFFPTNQDIDRIHFFPAKYEVIQ